MKPLKKTGKPLGKPAPKTLKKGGKPMGKSLSKKEPEEQPKPKQLKKALPAPPPPPKSAPIPEVPKSFDWKGKKIKTGAWKGRMLVEGKNMPKTFPKMHATVPPGTVWRVDPKDWRNDLCLVTQTGTVSMAWATCSVCHNVVYRCICSKGFYAPRSVEWCWIKGEASAAGEDWAKNGQIDASRMEVTSRGRYWYKGKETGYVSTGEAPRRPVAGFAAPVAVEPSAKPSDRPAARRTPLPKKTLTKSLRKSTPAEPVPDIITLNKGAAAKEKDALRKMEERLAKKPVKPMKKTLKKRK